MLLKSNLKLISESDYPFAECNDLGYFGPTDAENHLGLLDETTVPTYNKKYSTFEAYYTDNGGNKKHCYYEISRNTSSDRIEINKYDYSSNMHLNVSYLYGTDFPDAQLPKKMIFILQGAGAAGGGYVYTGSTQNYNNGYNSSRDNIGTL